MIPFPVNVQKCRQDSKSKNGDSEKNPETPNDLACEIQVVPAVPHDFSFESGRIYLWREERLVDGEFRKRLVVTNSRRKKPANFGERFVDIEPLGEITLPNTISWREQCRLTRAIVKAVVCAN